MIARFAAALLCATALTTVSAAAVCPAENAVTIRVAAEGERCRPAADRACSPAEAQTLARARLAAMTEATRGDVTLALAPGAHRLRAPLAFTGEDGGRFGCAVTWRSERADARAVLTSAAPIADRAWRPWKDGIWRAPIPQPLYDASLAATRAVAPEAQAPTIAGSRTLLVAGERTRRAGMDLNAARLRAGKIVERILESDPIYVPNDNGDMNPDGRAMAAGRYIVRPGVLPDGVGDLAVTLASLKDNPQQIETHTLFSFERFVTPAEIVVAEGGEVSLKIPQAQWDLIGAGLIGGWKGYHVPSPDRIENAKVFLDEPGEFFIEFDQRPGLQAGRRQDVGDFIYYKPRGGARPQGASLPVLETLIEVEGGETAPVRNLFFKDLDITGTTLRLPVGVTAERDRGYFGIQGTLSLRSPQDQGGMLSVAWEYFNQNYIHDRKFRERFLPSAIEMRFAQGGGVEGARFLDLGGSGLALNRGVRGASAAAPYRIYGNRFEHLAANAIRLGSIDANGAGEDPLRPNDVRPYGDIPEAQWPADRARVMEHILVAENVIRDIGVEYLDALALFYANVRQVTIDKNTFENMPYQGINAGYGFGFFDGPQPQDPGRRYAYKTPPISAGINITRNRFIGHCALTDDCGGLYTNSAQPGSLVQGNVFEPDNAEVRWGAFFIDEGTSGMTYVDNVVYGSRNVINVHCDAPEPVTAIDFERLYFVREPATDAVKEPFYRTLPKLQPSVAELHCNPSLTTGTILGTGDNYPRLLVGFAGAHTPEQAKRPVLAPDWTADAFIEFPDRAALLADPRVAAIVEGAGATPGIAPPQSGS